MSVIIPPEKINDIAQNLEMGHKCWYHIPSGEVLWVPDELKHSAYEEEMWEDVLKEIDEKLKDSIFFEAPDSREEFNIMESFAENEVADRATRGQLIFALGQRKPFMQFKSAIHYHSDYLEAWYKYRTKCFMDHVQQQLDYYNNKENSEPEEE